MHRILLATCAATALAACGGGGDSSGAGNQLAPLNTAGFEENAAARETQTEPEVPSTAAPAREPAPLPAQKAPAARRSPPSPPPPPRRPPPVDHNEMDPSEHNAH